MKINGKRPTANVEVVVIPRGDGDDIVFHCGAVMDFDPFLKLCPPPVPPSRIVKGGKRELNVEDPGYKEAVEAHSEKRIVWMCLESLKGTEGLEWETVKIQDHRTWTNFDKELRDSGLSSIEVQRVVSGVLAANCLSERRIEEARESFLRGRQEPSEKSSGDLTEQPSTSSGESA